MGDGAEPLIRGFYGCVGTGLVGIAHGVLDSTKHAENLLPYVHQTINFLPPALAGAFTAFSEYGLWTKGSRVGAFGVEFCLSGITEVTGYLIGRVATEGVKNVFNLDL